ncbi:Cue3p KNAG_0F02340 [Huiozyma naganishii CBS 8797]|uniref:CUE domain-containing protein n=1 Tax=Huiozyma naganishii (strain ATCC MYA-139 / BCRC 22969 / CBS 8797 / KCTC 17520 / NBRC 10181 / NCYC 3082 / Yp74L-3) TaxID=1071383 RepID=J7S7C6_HUIN7|nr:hypothetical protein KNAG_0F02340 [Kazachstania naganishii CBS 8797]CCK70899.1 hypothetical protein KNAG_0F02340 [Kazachstania naganishii CBS 8797]
MVVDIEGHVDTIRLHIVRFPPLKLRAQLVEKDPVVWLHLIEAYVQHCEWLLQQHHLDLLEEATWDELRIWVRTYMHEMASEEGKLVSLGANHDVTEQLKVLRAWVFELVKTCGLLQLQVFGELLWDMIKLYIAGNCKTVRRLVLGDLPPKINTQKAQINRIVQVQSYLKQLIESNHFDRTDLKSFQNLLKNNEDETHFTEKFVNGNWVEILEALWGKGKGKFASIAMHLMITSLYNLSTEHIASLVKSLDITNVEGLLIYPLLGSVLTSPQLLSETPTLAQALPFLALTNNHDTAESTAIKVDEQGVQALQDLFPDLTRNQVFQLLQTYSNDVESITDKLLEDPTFVDSLPAEVDEDNTANSSEIKLRKVKRGAGTASTKHVPDEVRNKTLARALALMYQEDEDERDDTYDEPTAEINRTAKVSFDSTAKDDNDDGDVHGVNSEMERRQREETAEKYLWELLKQDKVLFMRTKRGSADRKNMRKHTNWSDEQIEGWARMIERSPQRARLLEDKYMWTGNSRGGKTSYVHNKQPAPKPKDIAPEQDEVLTEDPKGPSPKHNKKKKASTGNHNRRMAHGKKLSVGR